MYRIPIEFYKRLQRGEIPITYITIETHFGTRAYAEKTLSGVFAGSAGGRLDGSWLLDGSETLGVSDIGYLDSAARVLEFGAFERTIQPEKDSIMASVSSKQLQRLSIELDNADGYFARIIPREPFLGRPINIYVGFEDDAPTNHLRPFAGIITEMRVMQTLTIEADER